MKPELAHVLEFLDDMILRSEQRIERHRKVDDDDYYKGYADGTELVIDNVKFVRKWLDDIVKEMEINE